MAASPPWSDPSPPQPGGRLPVSLGPMTLPVQKPKRRWGVVLGLMLLAFAGGVAAGPTLIDHACVLVEGGAALLGRHLPRSKSKANESRQVAMPAPVDRAVAPAPQVARSAAQAAAGTPSPAAELEKSESTNAPAEKSKLAVRDPSPAAPSAPERAEPEETPGKSARPGRTRSAAKSEPIAAEASKPRQEAAPAPKQGRFDNPFDTSDEDVKPAAPTPAAKPAASEAVPRAAKSGDSLDNLMADVVTETKGKTKKPGSKDIDSLLKDVQKSEPAPARKKEPEAELPNLSPADIAKVMAKVKTRANACGQQFGGKGLAELTIVVGKDGKVSNVDVGGKVAGSPTADCIAKAVRAATFSPNAGLRFNYRIDVR